MNGGLEQPGPSRRRPLADLPPRRRGALLVVALLALPVLCFLPAALHRAVFFVYDIQCFFYPFHAASAAIGRGGELPLWNPYAYSGMPLLGDAQSALLYPPNWLFSVLPADVAFSQVVILQFCIAGVAMYFFLRQLPVAPPAAFLGAVVFMFCGFMTARVVHLSILSGTALIPLVFLCLSRALSLQSAPWTAAAAGALALQLFTGHPQVPLYTAGAVALYVACQGFARWRAGNDHDRRDARAVVLRGLAVLVLGYALAAVQLLPLKELLDHSHRAGSGVSYDFIFKNSSTLSDWFLLLFPYAFGSLRAGRYSEEAIDARLGSPLWEHSIYVGILPLALAALAVAALVAGWRRARRGSVAPAAPVDPAPADEPAAPAHADDLALPRATWTFFAVLLALSVLVALGKFTPLSHLIYRLPVLGQLRDVERAMVLGDFALAALAALGFELLRRVPPRPAHGHGHGHGDGAWRWPLVAAGLFILALPLLALGLLRLPPLAAQLRPQVIENLQLPRWNALVPLLLAVASAGWLIWCARRPPGPWAQALAVALVVADLGSYAAAFNPTTDPSLFRQPPEVMAAFRDEKGPFRKATFLKFNHLDSELAKEALAVSWGMVFGIEDVNGFSSLQPRRYTDYLFDPETEEVSLGNLDDRKLLRAESPILSSLNVKYLLVPNILRPRLGRHFKQVHENDLVRVFENRAVYPRAYFPAEVRPASAAGAPGALLAAVKADGFDGRKLAYVEDLAGAGIPGALLASGADPATVSIKAKGATYLRLETSTTRPRLLVLSEMYFPGWRASVDGVETPIYRTNYLFRGVAVPAGTHQVTLEYRPRSARVGLMISGATAVVLLAWLGLGRARRRAGAARG